MKPHEASDVLTSIARSSSIVFFRFESHSDGTMCLPYVSDSFEAVFGVSPNEVQTDIRPVLTRVHPDDLPGLLDSISSSISSKQEWQHEFRVRSEDGTVRWIAGQSRYTETALHAFRFDGHMVDVTRQRERELRLQDELSQSDLRLQELAHRVKNNMATVLSLLELQRSTATSAETRQSLEAAQNRVRAVLLLYQELEPAGGTTRVKADAYLHRLLPQVVGGLAQDGSVELDVRVDPVHIDSGIMSALALIINESVTNAMKYAFDSHGTRRIGVRLQNTGHGRLKLSIQDNGRGFTEHSRDGFGLTLIRSLSEQINAELSIRTESGTSVELEFDEPA